MKDTKNLNSLFLVCVCVVLSSVPVVLLPNSKAHYRKMFIFFKVSNTNCVTCYSLLPVTIIINTSAFYCDDVSLNDVVWLQFTMIKRQKR